MAKDFMKGSSLLLGDNTTPGVQIPEDLKKLIPNIFKTCKDFGLDFYPTVVQMLTYDEISEIAAYGGFPVRYPHWSFGMEYEELQRGYMYGMHKIYEMVVNTSPCYIYCLDSNTLLDNVLVISHALGHNDFFKNNIYFSPTSQNMMNQLANNGTRIRRYMSRWGKEKVTEFIDHVLRISTLIDFNKAWEKKEIKTSQIIDNRNYYHPKRLNIEDGHEYMDNWINDPEWIKKQKENIKNKEAAEELGIQADSTRDIFGFLKDNALLKPWQSDVLSMLYQEQMYFAPQRLTKMLNEGWASYIDYVMMCRKGLVSLGQPTEDSGIVEYALHKMGVLGGKYSTNPYKLGFSLFLEIEERWNKGRFGDEYEECTDLNEKLNWDTKTNLGKEKVFEVRKYYNDLTAIIEFFTPEFCEKYEFFNWKRLPNDDIIIQDREFKKIKSNLINSYKNGGLPEIYLLDSNYRGKGYLFLQCKHEGRDLLDSYVRPVLSSLYYLWGNEVYLSTKGKNNKEIIYIATGADEDEVIVVDRKDLN